MPDYSYEHQLPVQPILSLPDAQRSEMVLRSTEERDAMFAHCVELFAIHFLVRNLMQTVGCEVFALLVHSVGQIDEAVVPIVFDPIFNDLIEIGNWRCLYPPRHWFGRSPSGFALNTGE